jgi:tetratricopeptide (TPR) repeat protein
MVWGLAGLVLRIGRGRLPADGFTGELPFIIAVVFLLHPCQTQAVTYVSQRFEALAAFFYLSTVYAYLQGRTSPPGSPRILWFVLAAVAAMLGIISKETAVTIPVMLLASEWILLPQRQDNKPVVFIVLGMIAAFFALVLMKLVHSGFGLFFQTIPSQSHDNDVITGGNYLLTQMRVFLTFLRLLVWPAHQNLDYDYPLSTGILHPPLTLIGMLVIGTLVFFIFKLRKDFPVMAFGVAWMLITFSINGAPRANVIWEHKLYLISFGFFLVAGVALSLLIRQRVLLMGLILCLVTALGGLSFERNHVWQSNLTLWEDVLKKSPFKKRVYENLGWSYGMAGMYDDAIYFLRKAVEMDPGYYKNTMNLGDVYYLTGQDTKALIDFNKALELDPLNFGLYVKRAKVYKDQKNYEGALNDLNHSIRLKANFEAYMQRTLLWMMRNQMEYALEDVQAALRLQPGNYDALINRAGVYFCMKRYEEAIQDLNQAEAINSTDYKVYKDRAYCYMAIGKKRQAQIDLAIARALRRDQVADK